MKSKDIKISCWASKENSAGLAEQFYACPTCNGEAKEVSGRTVRHFIIDSLIDKVNESNYRICLDEDCEVVYYDLDKNIIFKKQDMKIPIWYKKDADPKYICYCNHVTEEQIINAVLNDGAKNIKDIIKITGAMKNGKCKINNPLGECCGPIIQETINKILNIES